MQFCIHQSIGTTVLFRQSGQKHPQNNNNFCRPKEWTYQMWPTSSVTRLGEIRHFGKIFKVLGNILTVYLLLGKFSGLLRQISYAIGQIFIDVNGQMLKNNLATWSHCRPDTHSCTVSIPNPSLSLSFMHTPTHIRIMKKHVLRGRQKIGGCGRDPFCFESGSFKDAHVGRR